LQQRPETIFGDSAICINPNDERFAHLKEKKVLNYLSRDSLLLKI
jgi:valyl-tRNA synthetase